MNNKEKGLDIYLMGIGGTGMGAFAGLLKKCGHRINGSDNAVYSPMKEKLAEWDISYQSPYDAKNLANPDLVIVGNVIRRDNPEAEAVRERGLAHESFPSALKKLFLSDATPIVACGTHGKTTCSALLAHTLYDAGFEPGFLIGGIPLNFGESFRASEKLEPPFVVEGDEYDTAYFDKRPKFVHYDPHFLLLTSIEFDHADIYPNLDAIINAFSGLLRSLNASRTAIVHSEDSNIKEALKRSETAAKIFTYGARGDYQALEPHFGAHGISFQVLFQGLDLGRISIPLFGRHNLDNALGCYAILRHYGLNHEQIARGFQSFQGVKRRLEQRAQHHDVVIIDDFAHHPTAVRETLKAARQRFPDRELWAIFEPRSATSCMKLFEGAYQEAFINCDEAIFAPVGRKLDPSEQIDTEVIATALRQRGKKALACQNYEELENKINSAEGKKALLFMSNGNFGGILEKFIQKAS